jgi:predicted transcriptional regulator
MNPNWLLMQINRLQLKIISLEKENREVKIELEKYKTKSIEESTEEPTD